MKVREHDIVGLDTDDIEITMLIRLIESKRRVERTDEIYLPYEKLGWIEEKCVNRRDDIRRAFRKITEIYYFARGQKTKGYDNATYFFENAILWDDKGVTVDLVRAYGEMIEMGLSLFDKESIMEELKLQCEQRRGSLGLRYHTFGDTVAKSRMRW